MTLCFDAGCNAPVGQWRWQYFYGCLSYYIIRCNIFSVDGL
ncbi:hypothetical protein HMPREF0971_00379 [Segatella oris F0302]|uniref:Uncharacterized protein n=1 Tax=Segatella oris F0302 TaxID=649760 RepID=D1QN43_9BACT|nr:hypothetical protein HMPREF0971_00379 [Segatella oris F0302]